MTTERVTVYAIDATSNRALQRHVVPGEDAHCDLYGWHVEPPAIDAGPEAPVEEALAAALVRCGTLAFLADPDRRPGSSAWTMAIEGSWLQIQPTLFDRVRRRLPPWILATRHAEPARQLFSGAVSWGQQHQVGLLLRDGALPILGRQLVVDLLGARDAPICELGLPDEVIALVFPAVDGDYLEIVAREASTRDAIRGAIADECGQRGLSFDVR